MTLPSLGNAPGGVKCDVSAQVADVAQRHRNGGGERWIAGAGDFAMQRHAVGFFRVVPDHEPVLADFRVASSATSAICDGFTNMPLTFAVWSARPSQPLMRMLVRPHGLCPGASRTGRRCAKRISGYSGLSSVRDHDFADFAGGDRLAGARPHDFDDDALVDDHALARGGLVRDRAEIGDRIASASVAIAARAQRMRAALPATPQPTPAPSSKHGSRAPSSSAFSRMIRRNDGVPT